MRQETGPGEEEERVRVGAPEKQLLHRPHHHHHLLLRPLGCSDNLESDDQ